MWAVLAQAEVPVPVLELELVGGLELLQAVPAALLCGLVSVLPALSTHVLFASSPWCASMVFSPMITVM